MSDKMVEEMARAMREKLHELDADPPFHADALAQAAATIAERRMEEMRAERDKWKQRAFELECEHGDLKGVFVESRAALRPSGGEYSDMVWTCFPLSPLRGRAVFHRLAPLGFNRG